MTFIPEQVELYKYWIAEREGIRLLESNGYWKAANILHERGIV